jgi:DNA repair protein RecO (recombination protein O)
MLEEAYLLHRRNFRETSLLLEFFTRSQGRVALLGKGTRRNKSSASAVLWPFVPLRISWAGRGELPFLVSAERSPSAAVTDPGALACGLYLNELLIRMLAARDPHPEIFEAYRETLHGLADPHEREAVLRVFEVRFLAEIGYALPLDHDAESGFPVDPAKYYVYRVEYGPIQVDRGPGAVSGATLLALKNQEFNGRDQLSEAKALMRLVIAHHLGGKPLKSRELFRYSKTS